MQKFTEIIPLICTSPTWGQYPVFSHPESPQGSLEGVAAAWWLLDSRVFFPSCVSSGLTGSHSMVATIADDCENPLFTDMAGNISVLRIMFCI